MYRNRKFIGCECGAEGMLLDFDPDVLSVYMAFYVFGIGYRIPWKQRLKNCWHILKHGSVYSDQMCLGKEEILELKKYLNWALKQIEKMEK